MTDRCPICDFPLATDDDTRRAMSDDERAGMCWSFGGRCLREPVDWRARALAEEKSARTWRNVAAGLDASLAEARQAHADAQAVLEEVAAERDLRSEQFADALAMSSAWIAQSDARAARLAACDSRVAARDRSIDALTARVATLTAALDVEIDLCTEALVTVASLSADRDSWRRWAEILDFVAEEAAVRA